MTRTPGKIAANPARVKWCAGPCGRQLPVVLFHRNCGGWPQNECKGCHRVRCRRLARMKYRRNAAYRHAQMAKARAWYAANQERKRAYDRARRAT